MPRYHGILPDAYGGTTQLRDGKGGAIAVGGGVQVGTISPQDCISVENDLISGCSASGNGGGIYTTIRGRVMVRDSRITDCEANNSRNVPDVEGLGGGIAASAGAELDLNGENIISDNTAATSGGGISVKTAGANFYDNVTVEGNTAQGSALSGFGNGGGVFVTTSFYDDAGPTGAGWGAAMAYGQDGSLMSVTPGLLIQANAASRFGGGVYAGVYTDGFTFGGIRSDAFGISSIYLQWATVQQNIAPLSIPVGTVHLSPSEIVMEQVGICAVDFTDIKIAGVNALWDVGIYSFKSLTTPVISGMSYGKLYTPFLQQ